MKGKLMIGKRFTKFYFNSFTPMTKLEKPDLDRSRYMYRAFLSGGAITLGLMSFKVRKM